MCHARGQNTCRASNESQTSDPSIISLGHSFRSIIQLDDEMSNIEQEVLKFLKHTCMLVLVSIFSIVWAVYVVFIYTRITVESTFQKPGSQGTCKYCPHALNKYHMVL